LGLDPVMVSRFHPLEASLSSESTRIRKLLERFIEKRFITVPLEDVAPFPTYSAEVYLESCPLSELIGCAYVIGGRGEAEWVVTGTIAGGEELASEVDSVDDSGEPVNPPRALDVTVTFVDVQDSRAVLSFEASVKPWNEDVFAEAVAEIVDRLVAGEGELTDLRGDVEDPVMDAERRRVEAAILAATLSDLEDELGAMARNIEAGRVKPPKLTSSDLDNYENRDDAKPWERIDMNRTEYLRFRNSGKNLFEWRDMARGRAGQLILRVGGGGGIAPYDQHFDGRWVQDNQTLAVIEVDTWQAVVAGKTGFTELEVGFGLLPILEVGVAAGFRTSGLFYLFHSEVEGQPKDPREQQRLRLDTFQVAGRVTIAPMPTFLARPTLTSGILVWFGQPIDRLVDLDSIQPLAPLPAPKLTVIQIAPGGEVNLGRNVLLFARLMLTLPVLGNRVETFHSNSGESVLINRSEPDRQWTPGVEGYVGIQVRIGPFGRTKKPRLEPEDL